MSVFPHVRAHDLRIVIVLAQVVRNVGVQTRDNHADMIGRVDVALSDGGEHPLARGLQTQELAWGPVSLRRGLFPIERALNILQCLHALFDTFQFLALAARRMGTVAVLETLKLLLFPRGGVLQVDAVRLVTRRSVDAVQVADLLGVGLDHLFFVGVAERGPPVRHFLFGSPLGWKLEFLRRAAGTTGRSIRVGASRSTHRREFALRVLNDAGCRLHDRAHLTRHDRHVFLDRHRIDRRYIVRTDVMDRSIRSDAEEVIRGGAIEIPGR